MADYLQPVGFWSYTSSDDRESGGRLSQLRIMLAKHLQLRIGREPKVQIFQDVAAIPFGTDWLKEIFKALDASSFLIPIITPAFLQSQMCCREVMHFRARETAIGRDDLIFPLHYIDVDDIDATRKQEVFDPDVLTLLRARQTIDFRSLRLRDHATEAVEVKLDEFAGSIRLALRRQPGAPSSPRDLSPPATPPTPASPTVPVPVSPPRAPTPLETLPIPELVQLPAGSFVMGIPEEESKREKTEEIDSDARPLHTVTFARPFRMGKYPVTRGEYAAFVEATGYNRDGGLWRKPGFDQTDRHPVVNVSADDAEAYADWLNQAVGPGWRLPSEAEWEYAARAGNAASRFWGNSFRQAVRYAHVERRGTDRVDARQSNGFGLHDVLGNVWEWTADSWHDNYNGAPEDGSVWITNGDAARRVVRGGSWDDVPRYVRAGFRGSDQRGYRINGSFGFRLARTL